MKKNQKIIYDIVLDSCNNDESLAQVLMNNSLVLQYIEKKTEAIDRGSKSRFSFANLFAIYVVTENYIAVKNNGLNYNNYDGMMFSIALTRTRSLPFGSKLQNHALNHRCNEEFKKFFPDQPLLPIVRDLKSKRYWVEPRLLNVNCNGNVIDISELIIAIIDRYVLELLNKFKGLLDEIKNVEEIFRSTGNQNIVIDFIKKQLEPNVDARTFELVAFVILKYYYRTQKVYFGFTKDTIQEMTPELYKTGRTNANDGGIDYILKPLGRIYQVTEELDFKKYFLDIEKINHYSITFVVKTNDTKEVVMKKITQDAIAKFPSEYEVNKYLSCFEEVITINELLYCLNIVISSGYIPELLSELVQQTQLEFNIVNTDK